MPWKPTFYFDGRNIMSGSRAVGNTYRPEDAQLISLAFDAIDKASDAMEAGDMKGVANALRDFNNLRQWDQ